MNIMTVKDRHITINLAELSIDVIISATDREIHHKVEIVKDAVALWTIQVGLS